MLLGLGIKWPLALLSEKISYDVFLRSVSFSSFVREKNWEFNFEVNMMLILYIDLAQRKTGFREKNYLAIIAGKDYLHNYGD